MATAGGTAQLARGVPPLPRLRQEFKIRSILPQLSLHLPLRILLSRLHLLPSPRRLRSLSTDVWSGFSGLLRPRNGCFFRVSFA